MRQALSCFSEGANVEGCREKHVELQECLTSHPGLYPWVNEKNNDNGAAKMAENMIQEAEEKS